jgi:lysophospholipase L1-like esterase
MRYYDTHERRPRWVVRLVMLLLLVAVGVGTWRVTESRTSDSAAGALGTSGLPAGIPNTPASTPDTVEPDSSRIESVVMIGDSITRGSTNALRYALTASGVENLVIDGKNSRRIDSGDGRSTPESGMRALQRILSIDADPDAWVIALGTNDVGQYASEDEYRQLIRTVLDALPADRPLVWVDVYRFDHFDDTLVFNSVLREEIATRPDSVVVSWFDQAATRTKEIVQSDRVHPNDDGTVVFARVVLQGLESVT